MEIVGVAEKISVFALATMDVRGGHADGTDRLRSGLYVRFAQPLECKQPGSVGTDIDGYLFRHLWRPAARHARRSRPAPGANSRRHKAAGAAAFVRARRRRCVSRALSKGDGARFLRARGAIARLLAGREMA